MSFLDIIDNQSSSVPNTHMGATMESTLFTPLYDNTLINLKNLATACSHITSLTSQVGTKKDSAGLRDKLYYI